MRTASSLLFLLASLSLNAAVAETINCPDLGQAIQVGACPAEEELRHTYTGYCSDNARIYDAKDDVCVRFENYRTLKNVALWESADGLFSGYVSCDLPVARLKAARAATIVVARQGSISRLACAYAEGVLLSHRTTRACAVVGDGHCAGDGSACRASCQ
jgi:hypothetical protein